MNSKVLVWSYLIILSFATIFNLYIPKNEAVAKDSIVIPGEAIRLRILANSDTNEDQAIKRMVRDAVNAQITVWVQDLTSLDKAKAVIKSKMPEIQEIAEEVVAQQGSEQSVNVEFGPVQFPTKLYGQFLYPAGEYQAILITLGEGKGANWWCVLYPPLCFLDFSNGVAVSQGFEEEQTVAAAVEVEEPSEEQVLSEVSEESFEEIESEEDVEYGYNTLKERVHNKQQTSVETDFENVTSKEKVENKKTTSITQVEEQETTSKQQVEFETHTSEEQVEFENVTSEEVDFEKETSYVESKFEKEMAKEQEDSNNQVKKEVNKKEKAAPVYTSEDEEPVKVKFFVVEIFQSLFN